jgi:hypothetical protein
MKKFHIAKIILFIACIVDTIDKPLLSNISANFRKKFEMAPIVHVYSGATDS